MKLRAAAQWRPRTAIELEHKGLLLQAKSLLVIVIMELRAVGCGQWWPWTVGSGSQQLELEHKE